MYNVYYMHLTYIIFTSLHSIINTWLMCPEQIDVPVPQVIWQLEHMEDLAEGAPRHIAPT